jgi:DnaK suppressor protein
VPWWIAPTREARRSFRWRPQVKKSELKVFKDLLIGIRSRLRGDVSHMADAALGSTRAESSGDLSSMPIHMADLGTDNFEQEFTLSLMEHDEDLLGKVEAALERIEDGVYGACVECEAKIPKTRLNVLPYTPHCVKCAGRTEGR